MLHHIFPGKVPCALARVAGQPALLCSSGLSLPMGAIDQQWVSFLCCREPELSPRLLYMGFLCWWQAGGWQHSVPAPALPGSPASALRCAARLAGPQLLHRVTSKKKEPPIPRQSEMDESIHWDWGICRSSTSPSLWAFGDLSLLVILRLESPSSSGRVVVITTLQDPSGWIRPQCSLLFWWSPTGTKYLSDALDFHSWQLHAGWNFQKHLL